MQEYPLPFPFNMKVRVYEEGQLIWNMLKTVHFHTVLWNQWHSQSIKPRISEDYKGTGLYVGKIFRVLKKLLLSVHQLLTTETREETFSALWSDFALISRSLAFQSRWPLPPLDEHTAALLLFYSFIILGKEIICLMSFSILESHV